MVNIPFSLNRNLWDSGIMIDKILLIYKSD